MTVQARVSEPGLRILTTVGETVATHHRAPTGAGQTIRSAEHAAQLQQAILAAFTTGHACRKKANRPPGVGALQQLARLRGVEPESARVISLADYQQLAEAAGAVMSR